MKSKIPIVLSGSSNPPLASSIAKYWETRVGSLERRTLANQEILPRVMENVSGKPVIVIQSLSPPAEKHFFEFALTINALQREAPSTIIGVIPWLAYSLQDRRFRKGEPVSAKTIATFIDGLGIDRIVLIDLHSKKAESYFKTPTITVRHDEVFQQEINKIRSKNLVIIAPDEGARTRAQKLAHAAKTKSLQMIKLRDRETGKVTFNAFEADVSGKECLMCDDVIITGTTLVGAATILRKKGAATIRAYCTHAILADGSAKKMEKSAIDEIVVSDTILLEKKKRFPKLRRISCASVIAKKVEEYLLLKSRN